MTFPKAGAMTLASWRFPKLVQCLDVGMMGHEMTLKNLRSEMQTLRATHPRVF